MSFQGLNENLLNEFLVTGEWLRAAQVSFFKLIKSNQWCGAAQHPHNQRWQSWARLYANDLTCLSVYSNREEAEQAILGFVYELRTGKLANAQAKAVFIHNFEVYGLGQPEQLEPRQIVYIQQWIKRQLIRTQPFYVYAFAGKGRGSKTYRWRQVAGPFERRAEAQLRLKELLQLQLQLSNPIRSSEPNQKTTVICPPAGIAAYIVEPVCEKFLSLSKKDPAVKVLSQEP